MNESNKNDMTQRNSLRHIWKVKMIGICELLNVGDKWIYEKYKETYSSLWALSINMDRAVFGISKLVPKQVYKINVDLMKRRKLMYQCHTN